MPVAKQKGKKVIKKDTPEKKIGAPSKYRPEMCQKAEEAASRGLINATIAEELGITRETLNVWMHEKPDFSDAVKRGKAIADDKVERTLYEMALGYSHTVQKPIVVGTGKGFSEVEIIEYTEKLPPNMTAIIFHLKNRKPKEWRDKQEIGLTDAEGNDRNFQVSFIEPSGTKKK